ncbi:hypothetical protein BIFDEN_00454 [Bifidobacterium dentium ATCC 27678]|nr:hypothetical protein BIFDEN_00454 [Bifidobacterium dentium ATCC 27678]
MGPAGTIARLHLSGGLAILRRQTCAEHDRLMWQSQECRKSPYLCADMRRRLEETQWLTLLRHLTPST